VATQVWIITKACLYSIFLKKTLGEDGVEISIDQKDAAKVLEKMLQSKNANAKLAGLGSRDALRVEAGLCLYGSDINENTTPVEAAIAFVIAKRRRQTLDFPGAKKIVEQLEKKNYSKRRVGFIAEGGRCPREHLPIMDPMDKAAVGFVTSGCPSPCLSKNIAVGYVDKQDAKIGKKLHADFGKKNVEITVTKMPFVPTKYYTK
jgi:aminomethyltransferase